MIVHICSFFYIYYKIIKNKNIRFIAQEKIAKRTLYISKVNATRSSDTQAIKMCARSNLYGTLTIF